MPWYGILLLIIASLLLLFLALSFGLAFYFAHLLTHPHFYDRDFCRKTDIDKGLIPEEVLSWKKENCPVTMEDGYVLHGDFYPGSKDRLLIFAHGYTWTREGSLKYARLFHRLGYSLYLYDERGHGDNVRTKVTLGYRESKDLHEVVRFFRKRLGEKAVIGLHGESMGGATVLLEMEHAEDDLSFVIADSPFASMRELMHYQIHLYHVPGYVADLSNLILKVNDRFSYRDVEPKESLKKSTVPLLLIQGDHDTFIPPGQTKELYEARKEKTTLKYFKGADHTQSYLSDPEGYEETETEFLRSIHLLGKEE